MKTRLSIKLINNILQMSFYQQIFVEKNKLPVVDVFGIEKFELFMKIKKIHKIHKI